VGLVGVALLASSTNVVPDLITTVAAIVGVAAMIHGVATGTLIVFNREPDE
jgi:hydrogenase/urease accessory protein HupE